VYRGEREPERHLGIFALYVSFFPQLVAGPIERSTRLLPQFFEKMEFDYRRVKDGLILMAWGFFKKVVIADWVAIFVNQVYSHPEMYPGLPSIVATYFFAIQIYCDFSGYSDIAIGTGRLFGFNLMQNFAFPYFSRDIAEFWRRWHISLSTWFRDYIYIPLGGSRGNREMQFRNVLIIFLVSGFWHGANFTFIAWGAVHALMFIPLLLAKKNRQHTDCIEYRDILKNPLVIGKVIITFLLVTVAWVFFRMPTLGGALHYIEIMGTSLFSKPTKQFLVHQQAFFYGIIIMLVFEWINRTKKHGLQIDNWPVMVRWVIYLFLAFFIFMFGNFNQVEFIYFAF
jgi:D-alanyl-lipoteichoic acid acyltransferase DltB (MBOAT superfamily)